MTYLIVIFDCNLFQIYKHDGKANSVQVMNNLIISGSLDKTVQAWNMERHPKLWQSDYGVIVWSVILRDGQVIACREDNTESGKELHRL